MIKGEQPDGNLKAFQKKIFANPDNFYANSVSDKVWMIYIYIECLGIDKIIIYKIKFKLLMYNLIFYLQDELRTDIEAKLKNVHSKLNRVFRTVSDEKFMLVYMCYDNTFIMSMLNIILI